MNSMRKRAGKLLFCLALGLSSLSGAIPADELERLLSSMNQPKLERNTPQDDDRDDPLRMLGLKSHPQP